MKGNAQVMAGLQEAINLEASRKMQYWLDAKDTGRVGLGMAEGLKTMAEQSGCHMGELIGRLLFLEGAPQIAAAAAVTHNNLESILTDAVAMETAMVVRFGELCREAWAAGDMSNFHFFQHLCKWHTVGDDKFQGHIAWIQKKLWQYGKLGEAGFVQAEV